MAHIIKPIDIKPRTILNQTQRKLSCMPECLNTNKKDAGEIQQRINDSAKERIRLDYEIKKRYENIKHINFLG